MMIRHFQHKWKYLHSCHVSLWNCFLCPRCWLFMLLKTCWLLAYFLTSKDYLVFKYFFFGVSNFKNVMKFFSAVIEPVRAEERILAVPLRHRDVTPWIRKPASEQPTTDFTLLTFGRSRGLNHWIITQHPLVNDISLDMRDGIEIGPTL